MVIAGATRELYFSPPVARAVRSFVVVVLGGGGVMVLWSLLYPASRARLQNLFFLVPIEHQPIIIHPTIQFLHPFCICLVLRRISGFYWALLLPPVYFWHLLYPPRRRRSPPTSVKTKGLVIHRPVTTDSLPTTTTLSPSSSPTSSSPSSLTTRRTPPTLVKTRLMA